MFRRWLSVSLCVGLWMLGPIASMTSVRAQLNSSTKPIALEDVGINQRVGQYIPLNLTFRNEVGDVVPLKNYFHEKPLIVTLVYYQCPMLCTEVLNGLIRSLRPLAFNVGKDFDILTISFDPKDTPALASAKREEYIKQYDRIGASNGWHFLTGDTASIRALTDAVGFRYTYDQENGQFAHASSIIILTPHGQIARYYFGVDYPTKDVRLSLVEASKNKIGTSVDQVILYCFHYDPATGKYSLAIMNVIRVGGLATLLALGSFMIVMFRRDRREK